jgi:hypothetical protein
MGAREAGEARGAARPADRTGKLQPAALPPEQGMGLGSYLLIGLVVGVAVFGGLFWLRKRGASPQGPEVDEAGRAPETASGGGSSKNPFVGMESDDGAQPTFPMGAADSSAAAATSSDDSPAIVEPTAAGEGAVKGLSLDDLVAPDPVPESAASAEGAATAAFGIDSTSPKEADILAAPQSDGSSDDIGEEEVRRMLQEFERRIASLESRVDEVVDARERLERQVAAQTEELRVQRAAIARTQRAVRNLTRGDEDGPTEPALRDPN